MKNSAKWKIYWENYAKNSYINGSTIRFLNNNRVYFKNKMANTGIVIKSWESQYNFQDFRSSLELPLLNKNSIYEININAEVFPEESLYLRLNFFDIYSELIEYQIIQNMKGEFKVPKDTFKYNIEIFSAGLKEMTFSNLVISEKSNLETLLEEDNNISNFELNNKDNNYKKINVIFQEPVLNNYTTIDKSIIDLYKNVLIIKSNVSLLLENKEFLINKLEFLFMMYSSYSINFIGYGELTNKLAVLYAKKFNAKAYISDVDINIPNYSSSDYEEFPADFIDLYNSSNILLIEDYLATINDEITRKVFIFDYRLKLIYKEVI